MILEVEVRLTIDDLRSLSDRILVIEDWLDPKLLVPNNNNRWKLHLAMLQDVVERADAVLVGNERQGWRAYKLRFFDAGRGEGLERARFVWPS